MITIQKNIKIKEISSKVITVLIMKDLERAKKHRDCFYLIVDTKLSNAKLQSFLFSKKNALSNYISWYNANSYDDSRENDLRLANAEYLTYQMAHFYAEYYTNICEYDHFIMFFEHKNEILEKQLDRLYIYIFLIVIVLFVMTIFLVVVV